ncbi:MAG: DUF1585 domain-containing protein [Proteobacteria bacterium]|nr:MAG: DUF1585 domain-containing protein [Pseudomonadota bacterium]
MEPGYLISHTVAENKPFTDILTTQSTIMTGTFGYFMAGRGKGFWSRWPGGSIADANHAIFTAPKVLDRKHYWINRNASHAGVLTTQAYQIITNGRRAKANRTYETFLCKKFTVPDGAQADPADANPDLTKRTYCSYCHKSLEPMAAFFNRWPDTGNINYQYDNNKDPKNDTGRYNGMEGKGAAAFGKILAESDGFDECSIRRAFEFVNGRKMGFVEHDNILPGYLENFRAEQKNLRKVIKAMVLSPDFLAPKGASK